MTKVFLDGFLVDNISLGEDYLTPTVLDILHEQGKKITTILPIPKDEPSIVLLYTEIENGNYN